jgi:hypothetical protein
LEKLLVLRKNLCHHWKRLETFRALADGVETRDVVKPRAVCSPRWTMSFAVVDVAEVWVNRTPHPLAVIPRDDVLGNSWQHLSKARGFVSQSESGRTLHVLWAAHHIFG